MMFVNMYLGVKKFMGLLHAVSDYKKRSYRYERIVDVVINVLITGKFACYVKQKQTTEKPQNFNFLRP